MKIYCVSQFEKDGKYNAEVLTIPAGVNLMSFVQWDRPDMKVLHLCESKTQAESLCQEWRRGWARDGVLLNDVPLQSEAKANTSYVTISAAAISNYKGKVALIDDNNTVWLGDSSKYHHDNGNAYYDNSDGSLVYISKNVKMFSFLNGKGWTASQRELFTMGVFTMGDYQEFANLQGWVLSNFECERQITFGDDNRPFMTPFQLSQEWNGSVRNKLQQVQEHANSKSERPAGAIQEVIK